MIREENKKYELTENYKMLVTAVVEQACKDYDDILRYNLAIKQKKIKGDLIPPHKSGAYKFLMDPDNFYLLFLGIDGDSLVHKIEKNFKKYGRGIMTEAEWGEIRKIKGEIE